MDSVHRIVHDNLAGMYIHSSDSERKLTPDPLSDILQDLRLSEASYGRCELKRPWGIELAQVARLHFVANGNPWFRTMSSKWVELHPGDVMFLPHGRGHALADAFAYLFRYTSAHDHIGDRESSARLQHAERLTQNAIFVCGEIDHAVRDDDIDRVVGQTDVFDFALQETLQLRRPPEAPRTACQG